ncbi:hypothetical protein ElyMa_000490700 [Elysia marginata]|uniref:Uncharacterized protein n=1 Tax=Elysia marginata TaxID=1093978 RepID=A0AAV4FWU6_9GAST|nr:hypothetical protein ElyMa_000490700 [Elysia marginata]
MGPVALMDDQTGSWSQRYGNSLESTHPLQPAGPVVAQSRPEQPAQSSDYLAQPGLVEYPTIYPAAVSKETMLFVGLVGHGHGPGCMLSRSWPNTSRVQLGDLLKPLLSTSLTVMLQGQLGV